MIMISVAETTLIMIEIIRKKKWTVRMIITEFPFMGKERVILLPHITFFCILELITLSFNKFCINLKTADDRIFLEELLCSVATDNLYLIWNKQWVIHDISLIILL